MAKTPNQDHTHLFQEAVEKRMRIKELENNWIGLQTKEYKFMVYFMNPALFETKSNKTRTQTFS